MCQRLVFESRQKSRISNACWFSRKTALFCLRLTFVNIFTVVDTMKRRIHIFENQPCPKKKWPPPINSVHPCLVVTLRYQGLRDLSSAWPMIYIFTSKTMRSVQLQIASRSPAFPAVFSQVTAIILMLSHLFLSEGETEHFSLVN